MRYEKLVRDHIPAMITQRGDQPVTRILACDEYRHELRRKLHEEVAEFCATGEVEELADVLEVVYALAMLEGVGASAHAASLISLGSGFRSLPLADHRQASVHNPR